MSLRLRLLLSVALLVLVSLAVVVGVSTRVTSVELGRFAEAEEKRRLRTELQSLGEVLEATPESRWPAVVGDWQGSFDALLFEESGALAAASHERYEKAALTADESGVEIEVRDGEDVRAFKLQVPLLYLPGARGHHRLYLVPPLFATGANTDDGALEPFRESARRWTLGLALVLGLAALLAAATVARRLAGPLEELTAALRDGDLSRRLEVRGDDEISRLAAAFNDLAAGLERAERLRRNLVSDVAHELRTPLTHLRGEVESLEDGLLEPTPAVLASLREEVGHLERLVDDLQELALAEAGHLRFEIADVDLRHELEAAARGFSNGGNGGGQPRVTLAEVPSIAVRADPRRLRQILVNLLDNACRHTPPAGRVTLSATVDAGGTVTVRVRDGGPGIPPERRDDVFERFVRLDGSRQRATGGAGLGLAIVARWVEAHGGRVWIEDPDDGGSGTVFALTMTTAG